MYKYMYVFADQSANSSSSRGDYSRAVSISFRACSGAATIRERRLFGHIRYVPGFGIINIMAATMRYTDCAFPQILCAYRDTVKYWLQRNVRLLVWTFKNSEEAQPFIQDTGLPVLVDNATVLI